ncbi:YkuS family protein [Paenibacillus hamazuiensis]|uniref:YkuS family protein n=1 Tax=Paenibacillus hamazuiensis TaxID=2936508 RepID=UPI00200C8F16|nr:YkuS family protein [Paenibacillus hamazuiensis]
MKVAVENSLSHLKEALQNSGCEIVSMDNLANADCCVISGQDKNMMGMAETATKASVINADGLTDDEVVQQVKQRANRVH